MANWDDEEDDATLVAALPKPAVGLPKKSKFADEDASDSEVKDDWDVSDDEEELAKKAAAAKPAGPAPPVRAKGITKQKIAEREAAEQARLDALAARNDDDPRARKEREKAAMLKSDMDNAAALFGSTTVSNDPFAMPCKTKEDFDALSKTLAELVISRYGSNPLYVHFLESFPRNLCEPLRDVDVRKVASRLTTLSNEKQTAQKDAQGGKKKAKAKPGLGGSKTIGRADTGTYEEALDDSGEYDDFM